jgi:hypothetical protein
MKAIWAPLPGSQTLFLTCPVYEVLLEGTRGGGKTDTLLMSYAQHVGRGFGDHWRGTLFRLTYPQLADVVAKSKRWFYQIFPGAKFNESDYVWKWPTGEMLYFRYGANEDDYWNYHGHEYPWLGFEELTNWRNLSFYEAMHSTCRSSHPGMPRMVRATCNPFGVGHASVKERFQIGAIPAGQIIRQEGTLPRVRIHSTIYENTHLLRNDPNYLMSLESLSDPNRRRAWLEGDWDIHVGSFLEGVWQPSKHVVEPFAIPPTWKVWRSMDWGYARPYAIYWFALEALSQPPIHAESAKDFISRVLNPGPTDSNAESSNELAKEVLGDIKSKRGCERMQKIINEKRDLERQVEDLQVTVVSLQDAIRKYEIESKFVDNAMATSSMQKKPAELVTEAKQQIIKYLNSREDEVDHSAKAQCFFKYLTDPFYMQVFVQTNKPEQWQSMIESIYDSIEMQEPSFDNVRINSKQTLQPIRARN